MTDPETGPGDPYPLHPQSTADELSVRRPEADGHPRRRRLLRIACLSAAGLLLATVGAGAWFYQHLTGNLNVFDSGGLSANRPGAGPADANGTSPVNVLLLGSDTRANGNEDLAGGTVGAGNSDTALLVHVYADHRHAVTVSIPRDSLVDIPPCKLPSGKWTAPQHGQMFNSAFAVGGSPTGNPACSQNTVETMTGLRVDHTIVIDFKGFAAMTSAIGGVPVCVPNEVNAYGIHLGKGRQTVTGQLALDYVRARHGFGDGSDIGRVKRQQAFLSSLLKKVQDQGFNLTTLLPLADAATRSLTVDQGLGSALKLAGFVQSIRSIKLADFTFVTAPWRYAGDRVALVHPDVDELWALLRQDRTLDGHYTGRVAPTAPAAGASSSADLTIPVVVHNGTGTVGLADRAVQDLAAQGYRQVVAGGPGISRAVTVVVYAAGHQGDAEQLARLFPGAELSADPATAAPGTAGVSVELGHDYLVAAGPSWSTDPSAPSPAPSTRPATTVPDGIADNTRPADTDVCAGLTYG
ncbi:LCP family protein required for cell wall assembly [Kitasatospora sp. MAP12-15]|uniref:LCP family protein n=1 Tax=unclassified Kitasatospora TaxID=2633591 RepID=UPI002474318D|nr:LCP family protein [Kitasatospora sp. MAP12-44]MDH6110417.1 LCP family protein required for cell wall assembly [Kitasatospora sp. MAP12-44]